MLAFTIRRLGYAILTFLGITVVVFALLHAAPGDPVTRLFGAAGARGIPPEMAASIRAEYGLDEPLPKQYLIWLGGVLRFDFGRSTVDRTPVAGRIIEKLPNTLLLNGLALLLAVAVALPLGVAAAVARNGLFDRISGIALFLLYSLPTFWVALLLLELFAVRLELLPLYGMRSDVYPALSTPGRLFDRAAHLLLPVVTLSYTQLAIFARFSRSAIAEVAMKEFITAARAKGVSERRVVWVHALRNALIPMISLLGLVIPLLLSGSVIIERIFQWDGIGRLFFEALLARDYPMVMALTTITAALTLLASVLTDLLYSFADPRIRIEAS